MSDTVTYNGVEYSVDKILLIKGEGAKVEIDKTKQSNVEQAYRSDKTKHPIVIPVDTGYYTLIAPLEENTKSKVAYVLSKFVLKRLRNASESNAPLARQRFERTQPVTEIKPTQMHPLAAQRLTGIAALRARVEQQDRGRYNENDHDRNNYNKNSY